MKITQDTTPEEVDKVTKDTMTCFIKGTKEKKQTLPEILMKVCCVLE